MNESVIFKQEIGQFPFFFTPAADLLGILQRDSLSLMICRFLWGVLCIYFRVALLAQSGRHSCRTDDVPLEPFGSNRLRCAIRLSAFSVSCLCCTR